MQSFRLLSDIMGFRRQKPVFSVPAALPRRPARPCLLSTSHLQGGIMRDLDYLKLLAREFPNQGACQSEIINLSAILGLPKGTEYFLSDIHGEDKAFTHLLRSASGVIRDKIELIYGEIMPEQ